MRFDKLSEPIRPFDDSANKFGETVKKKLCNCFYLKIDTFCRFLRGVLAKSVVPRLKLYVYLDASCSTAANVNFAEESPGNTG